MTQSNRRILIHYHLFKNAGSSVDHILKKAYPDTWVNHDPGTPPHLVSSNELMEFVDDNPHLLALSSHMLVPPVPECEVDIFPIVFIREPITRVMSAYLFEWQKQKGVEEPIGSLSEYIHLKFEENRTSAIEDFQCLRLCNKDPSRRAPNVEQSDESILQNSKNFLKQLPLFGLVDNFDLSMKRFQRAYGEYFPEVTFESVAVNTTQSTKVTLSERLSKMEKLIGTELYAELILRNQLDIKLYQYATGLFDASLPVPKSSLQYENTAAIAL